MAPNLALIYSHRKCSQITILKVYLLLQTINISKNCLALILYCSFIGETYNIGSDFEISIADLAKDLIKRVGKNFYF